MKRVRLGLNRGAYTQYYVYASLRAIVWKSFINRAKKKKAKMPANRSLEWIILPVPNGFSLECCWVGIVVGVVDI